MNPLRRLATRLGGIQLLGRKGLVRVLDHPVTDVARRQLIGDLHLCWDRHARLSPDRVIGPRWIVVIRPTPTRAESAV